MILAEHMRTGADIAEELIRLRQEIDRLELEFSTLAAALAETEHHNDEGFNTPIDWLRINCHLTARQAGDRLAVGTAELRDSRTALEAGEIGFAHLAVLARTAIAVGRAVDEASLLEMAKKLSPGKLFFRCEQYRHSVDAKGYGQEQGTMFENRRLQLSTCEDGCLLLSGMLDPVSGAALRTALEPLARKAGESDTRDLPQRNADALVEVVCGGRPASLQITASVETLKGLVGGTGGENEFTLPIASSAVQRLACDCSVMRVLLDQDSAIVDVGRSKRIIGGALRKALRLRDQHCQWPGCERPASWCDGHHLVHWINGGPTDLENLVLLCRRHHRMVHEGEWQLIKTDEGELVPIAPTVMFGLPRGPD
jgi:hypothetical protein